MAVHRRRPRAAADERVVWRDEAWMRIARATARPDRSQGGGNMRIGPLKLKAQIFCGEDTAIGPGKADLLEAIDREGSISAAGRSMGMSYRRTWLLVDMMNRCWAEKLVETTIGGGRERGARVTRLGRQVLANYRALETRIGAAAGEELGTLAGLMLDRPLPSSDAARGPGR
jgi:molybdate transport system regulatory protein